MERHFKYFIFGLLSSICGTISLMCIGWSISMIFNIDNLNGWYVIFVVALIIFDIICFYSINWCFGKVIYLGHHMNNKICKEATEKEMFDAAKNERFYWNCKCEEPENEENS